MISIIKRGINKIKSKITSISQDDKTMYKSIIISLLIRGGALVLSLFTLPAYMRFFDDNTALGLWFTIVSVLNWFLNFDLGVGNGLRNKLVPCIVNNDKEKAKRYISSAYIIISIISVGIGIISFIVFEYLDWNKILNVENDIISNAVLMKTVKIVFIGVLLQFVLRLINSILYALQKSHIPAFLTLISTMLTLVTISIIGNNAIETNIIRLAYINVIATNLPLLVATILIFCKKLKYAWPNFRYYSNKYAKNILKLGGLFFGIQVMYMVISNTNEYLITLFYDPKYVVDYQIYYKLFNLVSTIFSIITIPIWSSITKSLAERNIERIKSTYSKLKKLALLIICGEFLLILFVQIIVNLWLGDSAIKINYLYAFIFAISGSAFIWSSAISSMSNGLNKIKSQFVLMTIAVVIEFTLLITMHNVINSWIFVIVVNIISILPYCIIEPFIINKVLNSKESEE